MSSLVLRGILSTASRIHGFPVTHSEVGPMSATSACRVPKSAMLSPEATWNQLARSDSLRTSITAFLTAVCSGLWSWWSQNRTTVLSVI